MTMRENPSTSVERALTMLDAIGARSAGMTNAEISRALKIPKSSASYILRSLEKAGYLRREQAKYRLGLKLLSLRHSALDGLNVRELAMPHLRALSERVKQTAHLAILDGAEAVYVEKVDAPSFIKLDTWIGRRIDLHSTSVGKAIAAYLAAPELSAILERRPLRRHTEFTIITPTGFLAELEKVRRDGYAMDDEENTLGLRCVAAPVFGADGRIQASVGVSGIVSQVTTNDIPRIAVEVLQAAQRVSKSMGYQNAGKSLSRV
ncbi:MAG: IclR family transcriptional regulator [Acidobacteriaceae bacterium]